MKNFLAHPTLGSRCALAVVAGLLLAASFSNIGIAGFAWIAPGLIAAAGLGTRAGESFRIGYLAGLTHYLMSLYWLLLIPYRWHSIPLGPTAGWLALSAFLALFPAIWVWLISGVPDSKLKTQDSRLVPADSWLQRTLWTLSSAAAWISLEMILARILGGFPWNLLGVSQHQMLPLIQISSITGVYGVSFLVCWVSLSLLSAGVMIVRQPTLRVAWMSEIILPLAVVAAVFAFGFRQLASGPDSVRTLKVMCVQPSIPQTLIWDPKQDDERFADLVRLSQDALTNRPALLLWPEAAVPKLLRYYDEIFQPVASLARDHHVWMIIGADDMEPGPGPATSENRVFFNSSFLVSPEGKLVARYRKRNLVIFGEYIPLQRWLPFLKYFTPIEGGFTPGNHPVPFELTDLGVTTSVLICFEDTFPQLAREYVHPDTDFLVNLTNNGWFGESAAQWQHAVSALFRAVENGLPLLRCSNNGLTCWVDAHGRLREFFHDPKGTVYGPGFMTAEIPLLALGEKRPPTFYNQHGDWFGWACVAVAAMLLLRRLLAQREAGRERGPGSKPE